MTSKLNRELVNLNNYLQSNRLSLNTEKTHIMIFSNNRYTRSLNLNVTINGEVIATKTKTSFLGVRILNSLSWSDHINHVRNKIAKSVGIIKKVTKLLNHKTLVSLYKALVIPYLNYCNLIWGNAPNIHLNKLHVLQKKAIRVIHGLPAREHTSEYFIQNNFLSIADIHKVSCIIFLYKLIFNTLPNFINIYFSHIILNYHHTDNTNNQLTTRGMTQNLLKLPRHRTTLKQSFFTYTTIKLYNTIICPYDLLNLSLNIRQLKKNVTSILIASY